MATICVPLVVKLQVFCYFLINFHPEIKLFSNIMRETN